jgi:hypothetical protein
LHIGKGLGEDLSLFYLTLKAFTMKLTKPLILFLALLFPGCIFVFLKFFGDNQFDVPPLFANEYPEGIECQQQVTLPYRVADSIQEAFSAGAKPLTLVKFGEPGASSESQLKRVKDESQINFQVAITTDSTERIKKCVFFLKDSLDLVLIDKDGLIRGQYISSDREEMDRLLTETSILLKQY